MNVLGGLCMIINGSIYVKKEKRPDLMPNHKPDENFWIFYISNEKILMYNQKDNQLEVYNSLEEIEKYFIKLEDFLDICTYLGNNLILPAGSELNINGKKVFCLKDRAEYIALYHFGRRVIIKGLEEDSEYKMIAINNPEFKKYVIDYKVNPEYSDKKQVYYAIISQIYKKMKKDDQELTR